MPVVFIHGVAVREEEDPAWAAVRRATQGIHWPDIRAALHRELAPILNPARPGDVSVERVYWGDLGARYAPTPVPAAPAGADPAALPEDTLGEALEEQLCARAPAAQWPELIMAAWSVARDPNLRLIAQGLPPAGQWAFLEAAALSRLPATAPAPLRPHLPARLLVQRRRNLHRALLTVRRPIESFVPIFLGDVLAYMNGRGTAGQPGAVPARVMTALERAHESRQDSGEPLVVLTHSLGGLLLYDVLTAFLPADPARRGVRVDFWCAAGSQVGPVAHLNLGADPPEPAAEPLVGGPQLGYYWNVWSESDLLSFPASDVVPGAHDTAFPLGGRVQSDHVAYLSNAAFYRTLAAKVAVHTRRPPGT